MLNPYNGMLAPRVLEFLYRDERPQRGERVVIRNLQWFDRRPSPV